MAFLFCVVGLMACAEESADNEDRVVVPELTTGVSAYDAFRRLPPRLRDGLSMRKSHVDHVAIEDVFATQFESGELVELLERWQPYILNLVEASKRLEPPLPEEQDVTDAASESDPGMDTLTDRLIENSRLLVADAVRCWSIGDHDGCAARFDAGLRMGLCMYRDGDSMHRRNATLLLQAVLVELAQFADHGLRDQLTPERIQESLSTMRALREVRRQAGTRQNTGTRILSRLIEDFSQEGE